MVKTQPFTICYSAQPNGYLEEHAEAVAELYDGFFFVVGSWDDDLARLLGVDGEAARDGAWIEATRCSVSALRAAGAAENFLTVHFSRDGKWPSPETLLSESFTGKMRQHFMSLGRTARDLGFRGVCIDVEYPYPRYEVDNEIYAYRGYTVSDLLSAARRQGRVSTAAILDVFPEAAIIVLPGTLRTRPIERMYLLGLLDEMAGRDAPGGLHLGSEFTYSLLDPVTNLAACRFEDAGIATIASQHVVEYWRRRCTIAPGVWPLHMVETGGVGYPIRPWGESRSSVSRWLSCARSRNGIYGSTAARRCGTYIRLSWS